MAVYDPARDTWEAVSDTGLGQARNGRVLWAESDTPDPEDWLVIPEGGMVTVAEAGYIRAVDEGALFVVVPI